MVPGTGTPSPTVISQFGRDSSNDVFGGPANKRNEARDMRYKGFLIGAFEQEPGKWRAVVGRAHSRRLKSTDDQRLQEIVAGFEHSSAAEALTKAMEAVDIGSPSSRR